MSAVASGQVYWDASGSASGTGGTGNWGTSNTWRSGSDTGTLGTWVNDGTQNAILAGTAGTLTVGSTSLLTTGAQMQSLTVNTTGYTITSTSGARPLVIAGALTLENNVALTLNMSSTGPNWSLGSVVFGSGSTLTVQGNATVNNSNRVDLTVNNSTITGGGINLAGTSAGPTGFVATAPSGSPIQVTLNTDILNNSATSATMLGANNSNTLIYGGVVSGAARLQISGGQDGGAGLVVLTNNSVYTGGTYFNQTSSGVTRLGISNALPTGTALYLQQSAGGGTLSTGGVLDLAGFNQTLAGVDGAGRGIANTGGAATLSLGGSGTYTLTSQIGVPTSTNNLNGANNNITVIKNGSGTQTFSGSKAFTGGLYINSGTLRITGSAGALGALPGSFMASVFLRGGTLAADTTAGNLDSGDNRGFEIGPANGSGAVTIQVEGTNSFIVRGNIADTPGGSGRLIKTGTGILRLQSNAKTFTGGISILEGTVSLSIDDRIGAVPGSATPGSILINGGTLLATDTFTLHANRGIALGPDTGNGSGTISVSSGVLTYEGIIANNGSGAGRLIKTGDGTLRLQNAINTFSGGLTILAGDVSVGIDNRLGLVPAAATPGCIVLDGGSLTITADMTLSSNRGIALGPSFGNGSGTINVTSTDTLTYGGIIADNFGGSGGLVKTGTGMLRTTNANTYSGGTTVAAGSLIIANASGSATGTGGVTTLSGTSLGGSGTVSPTGSNTVLIGGVVTPGVTGTNSGVGTLTFTPVDGNVMFQSGSSVAFELRADGSNDKIVFNASGAGLMDFSAMTNGSLNVIFVGGYVPALNDSFDLLDWSAISGAGINGLNANLLNLSTAGFDGSWSWDTSLFSTSGVISIVLVPEPCRSFSATLALGAVLLRRRR